MSALTSLRTYLPGAGSRSARSLAVGVVLSTLPAHALAHGLIQDPPSRNWFCGAETKPDQVQSGSAEHPECAGAFADDKSGGYQFMSVLTHGQGRSVVRPLPRNVCGFDSETWRGGVTPWDRAMDWPTTEVTPGPMRFTWNISWGPHFDDTEEFRYWITKPGFTFRSDRPLSWSDFEEEPFCVLEYDDKQPAASPDVVADKPRSLFHTTCDVPAREGHHVIYGEWGRNRSTYERFHGCVDVSFSGR